MKENSVGVQLDRMELAFLYGIVVERLRIVQNSMPETAYAKCASDIRDKIVSAMGGVSVRDRFDDLIREVRQRQWSGLSLAEWCSYWTYGNDQYKTDRLEVDGTVRTDLANASDVLSKLLAIGDPERRS